MQPGHHERSPSEKKKRDAVRHNRSPCAQRQPGICCLKKITCKQKCAAVLQLSVHPLSALHKVDESCAYLSVEGKGPSWSASWQETWCPPSEGSAAAAAQTELAWFPLVVLHIQTHASLTACMSRVQLDVFTACRLRPLLIEKQDTILIEVDGMIAITA